MAEAATIRVHVNGDEVELANGATVADVVVARGLRPEQVAVERNREIVPRAEHASAVLMGGDRLEIVTMVGGG